MRSLTRLLRDVSRKAAAAQAAADLAAEPRPVETPFLPVPPAATRVTREELVDLFEADFGSVDALRRELVPASEPTRKPVPAYVLWRGLPAPTSSVA